jgi:hydroxyethylthiazole kinase-like uncharacterized protein yjeF
MQLPIRSPKSHKGQNGRVLIVGGNAEFHGAPILAALGAEKTGVDLIFLTIAKGQELPAKVASPNFIVESMTRDFLTMADVPAILNRAEKVDALLVGNGLGQEAETKSALLQIVQVVQLPIVIDADGLIPELLEVKGAHNWVLTPHHGEFERVFQQRGELPGEVAKLAQNSGVTIVRKGPRDIIANAEGIFHENRTGVAEMTVGGSGDALSGLICGFLSQDLSGFEAAKLATYLWGKCGERLREDQYSFTALDLLNIFPKVCQQFYAEHV